MFQRRGLTDCSSPGTFPEPGSGFGGILPSTAGNVQSAFDITIFSDSREEVRRSTQMIDGLQSRPNQTSTDEITTRFFGLDDAKPVL